MKIAFLSDLHGSSCAARAGLEAADAWGADRIAILGDVMYHGPRNPLPQGYAPAEVARLLNRYASRVANEIALQYDPKNHVLQYCMASNISGVIGSAVAAGVLISFLG